MFRFPILYNYFKEKWYIIGFMCSVSILIFRPIATTIRPPFETLYLSILPMQEFWSKKILQPIQWIRYQQSGIARIADLETRNAQLRVKIGESEFLRKENEELKGLLNDVAELKNVGLQSVTTARIISHQGVSHVIDQGENQGVKIGDLILSNGALVGQVTRTESEFSEIEVIQDGTMRVLATTLEGITGIILARHRTVLFSEIPAESSLKVGEAVYSSGNPTSNVPAGIVIGYVSSAEYDSGVATQTVKIDMIGKSESFQMVVVGR